MGLLKETREVDVVTNAVIEGEDDAAMSNFFALSYPPQEGPLFELCVADGGKCASVAEEDEHWTEYELHLVALYVGEPGQTLKDP